MTLWRRFVNWAHDFAHVPRPDPEGQARAQAAADEQRESMELLERVDGLLVRGRRLEAEMEARRLESGSITYVDPDDLKPIYPRPYAVHWALEGPSTGDPVVPVRLPQFPIVVGPYFEPVDKPST